MSNLRFLEIKQCPFEPHNQVEIKKGKRAKQGVKRRETNNNVNEGEGLVKLVPVIISHGNFTFQAHSYTKEVGFTNLTRNQISFISGFLFD